MNQFKGKVSIIIPSHQEGIWLENTLRSIAANTKFPNYEIIIIDDASTDGSAKDLEAMWPDMGPVSGSIVKTLVVKAEEEQHGPAISRNRGLGWADGQLIVTLDAHMVLSKNWLLRLIEVHEKYPLAFLQGCSTGFRHVEDIKILECGAEGHPINDSLIELYKDEYADKPLILEIPRECKEEHFGKKDPQRKAMEMYGIPVNWTKEKTARIRVKGHNLMPDIKPLFQGAWLDYDPEDRGFITPKWSPWCKAGKGWINDGEIGQVNGFMGACYLFPRKLFEDRIGGWPQYTGWVHEEPYLSIAAGIQGIPIYLVKDVIAAHNYDRVLISPQNMERQKKNQKAVVHICFDDMKKEIYETIFNEPMGIALYPDWVEKYREKVQAGRQMSDKEFLTRAGLHWFFVPKFKALASKRLSAGDIDLSKTDKNGIAKGFDSLAQNKHVDWLVAVVKYQDAPSQDSHRPEAPDKAARRDTTWIFCANEWDHVNNRRSEQCSQDFHSEMIGELEVLLAIEKLKNGLGIIEMRKLMPRIMPMMQPTNTGVPANPDIVAIKE